jgi:hypothetical protein
MPIFAYINQQKNEKMKNLTEKIKEIKLGDRVNFINYGEGLEDKKQKIDAITDKAFLINGDWFPKSQIVDFDSITKEMLFNSWFAKKKTNDAWKNRAGGAY